MTTVTEPGGNLRDARVYLSGPMDFVASRVQERKFGWRTRVSQFLSSLGVTVFDPWEKPEVQFFFEYGREHEGSLDEIKRIWSYAPGLEGQRRRARCANKFWQTLHIDLRMVDTSDFLVAYCPTTIYSVGTVHEIVMARLQRKPVLMVSPRISIPELQSFRDHLKANDARAHKLFHKIEERVPIKENPGGIPSLWFMPMLGGHNFFDGFGFASFRKRFGWKEGPLDRAETAAPPLRPLLPYLQNLQTEKPKKYSMALRRELDDDDWLLWKFSRKRVGKAGKQR